MHSRLSFLLCGPARFFLSGVVALATGTVARAGNNDAIVVSATAAHDYVRPLDAEGRPAPETYVFMEGIQQGGNSADASGQRLNFDAITRVIATNLVKQNYLPTRNIPEAKLLIRVYWGTTQVYDDPQRLQNMDSLNSALTQYKSDFEANNLADPGMVNNAVDMQAGAQAGAEGAIARNAVLLGYKRSMDKLSQRIIGLGDEQEMRVELNEERYFVVLLAYDYAHLRQTKQARLLWTSRLSIRSPGNNFTEALPMLALAGAESYGRDLDDLQRVKVRSLPGGEVNMPEVKVLGPVGAAAK